MDTISLLDEVQKVVSREWPAFAQDHPRLAAVVDQTLLVEEATSTLANDAQFQQALSEANIAGMAATSLADLVSGFVRDWLRRLL